MLVEFDIFLLISPDDGQLLNQGLRLFFLRGWRIFWIPRWSGFFVTRVLTVRRRSTTLGIDILKLFEDFQFALELYDLFLDVDKITLLGV